MVYIYLTRMNNDINENIKNGKDLRDLFNLEKCLKSLSNKRLVFHSEADFQFALSWEIQLEYPTSNIRLEYPLKSENGSNIHIDIVVFLKDLFIPIELKYKTKKMSINIGKEIYDLKGHGAQDLGKYDFLSDIERLELLSNNINNYLVGYTLWLTNDKSYLNPPQRENTIYEEFSVHNNTTKSGTMKWLPHASKGTIKGREDSIHLENTYLIKWKSYSNIDCKNGDFNYSIVEVL